MNRTQWYTLRRAYRVLSHLDDIDTVDLSMDGTAFCATGPGFTNLQESPAGFGETALEAMAYLAKAMNLGGGKMWRQTFKDLLKVPA